MARLADRNRFASWTGTAPIDASSGEQIRHRLSRAGNRRLNHVLYIAAICQIGHDTPGRRYYQAGRCAEASTWSTPRLNDVHADQASAHPPAAGPGC